MPAGPDDIVDEPVQPVVLKGGEIHGSPRRAIDLTGQLHARVVEMTSLHVPVHPTIEVSIGDRRFLARSVVHENQTDLIVAPADIISYPMACITTYGFDYVPANIRGRRYVVTAVLDVGDRPIDVATYTNPIIRIDGTILEDPRLVRAIDLGDGWQLVEWETSR